MNLLEHLSKFLKKESLNLESPDDYCPNCWGSQEYSGDFYEAVYKEKITLDNLSEKEGWIKAYANEHLKGISVGKALGQTHKCMSCSL